MISYYKWPFLASTKRSRHSLVDFVLVVGLRQMLKESQFVSASDIWIQIHFQYREWCILPHDNGATFLVIFHLLGGWFKITTLSVSLPLSSRDWLGNSSISKQPPSAESIIVRHMKSIIIFVYGSIKAAHTLCFYSWLFGSCSLAACPYCCLRCFLGNVS